MEDHVGKIRALSIAATLGLGPAEP